MAVIPGGSAFPARAFAELPKLSGLGRLPAGAFPSTGSLKLDSACKALDLAFAPDARKRKESS